MTWPCGSYDASRDMHNYCNYASHDLRKYDWPKKKRGEELFTKDIECLQLLG